MLGPGLARPSRWRRPGRPRCGTAPCRRWCGSSHTRDRDHLSNDPLRWCRHRSCLPRCHPPSGSTASVACTACRARWTDRPPNRHRATGCSKRQPATRTTRQRQAGRACACRQPVDSNSMQSVGECTPAPTSGKGADRRLFLQSQDRRGQASSSDRTLTNASPSASTSSTTVIGRGCVKTLVLLAKFQHQSIGAQHEAIRRWS